MIKLLILLSITIGFLPACGKKKSKTSGHTEVAEDTDEKEKKEKDKEASNAEAKDPEDIIAEEFELFLSSVEDLESESAADDFGLNALIAQSNISIALDSGSKALKSENGRCMFYKIGDSLSKSLSSDLQSEGLEKNGSVFYSEKTNMKPADCRDFFIDALGEAYEENPSDYLVSFFSHSF